MVTETNRYAAVEINKQCPLRRESRLKSWKDTDAKEMKQFIALLLHMGPKTLPTIQHYWSTDVLYSLPFFGGVMSRNRFQLLLCFWHFADNDQHNDDRLFKIRTVLDHFNDVMPAIYYPGKDLSIDESMVLWRGKLLFRQYIKNKRHKYGIKLYELCEPRGTVLKIRVYSSVHVTDDDGYGQAAATVLDLLDGYLDKGHVVYTDNYYNSVSLVKKMTNRSTYLCRTLRFDRKENPKDLIKQKLKKGEHVWKRSESVVVCKWKDKREVLTISNMHRIEMVDVRNRNDKLSRKPNTVRDYNNGMAGVDKSDQMLSYYSALRKTIRWYKKIVLHILEVFLLNSHILYNANNREQDEAIKIS
ncbi:piggyBac transposable element-derived protein 4-like [Gigantopelta aegis]|uniref:piggyBac transposable element-derived protein 4-like n=1 Tax=Gigantopelta aegis TaxID=1735272 RepID=UPI001B88D53F|nr:piggyBac transposable element-derived protein 4-like [Gigantopelta aegis]